MRHDRPALIFDFGNVVARFDYARSCAILGSRLGLSGEQLLRKAQEAGLTALVQRYESGRMRGEDFSKAVCQLVGLDLPHGEFAEAWADIFWLNEPVARLVAWLNSRGYSLVLGSNTNEIHAAHFRHQFAETLDHFDHLVLSFEIGEIKPSAGFFQACARAAGRSPEDCIFIDDIEENIQSARALGMTGIRYDPRQHQVLPEELVRLGIEVPGEDRS